MERNQQEIAKNEEVEQSGTTQIGLLDNKLNDTNAVQDFETEGMFGNKELHTNHQIYEFDLNLQSESGESDESDYPLFGTHIREAISTFKNK